MEENVSQKNKEQVEEEMIEQAFQQLLNDYLAPSTPGHQTPLWRTLHHAPDCRSKDCM